MEDHMALKVGDPAPDFKLTCATGESQGEFELSAHRGKNVLLAFYPLDFTPVCQSELGSFQADLAKFTSANTEVVGICTDSVFAHMAFQKHLGGPYAEVATAYGVFPPTRHPIPFINDRAIFIVDKAGKIAWSKIYELREQPDNGEILAELKKLS
jgi:peroxiredoxin (alkyl hydroperoxide reductase subunit C)